MFRRAFLSRLPAATALFVGRAELVPAGIVAVTLAQERGDALVSVG